jgi:hypothetical protein
VRFTKIAKVSAKYTFSLIVVQLPEQNGEQDAHTDREKPESWCGSTYWADTAEFIGCGSRVEEEAASVAAFEEEEYQRGCGSVN